MTETTCTEHPDYSVEYRDTRGLLHRVDGPALTRPDGFKVWYHHGQMHRVGGPAVVYPDGSKRWFQHGRCHRLDGPALIEPDGWTEWWIEGARREDIEQLVCTAPTRTELPDGSVEYRDSSDRFHRVDGPAVADTNGEIWYLRGDIHRVDGPAMTAQNGYQAWYLHGQRHRVDGPAVVSPGVYEAWYDHGVLHRVDGPAVVHDDGHTEWWVDGERRFDVEQLIASLEQDPTDD